MITNFFEDVLIVDEVILMDNTPILSKAIAHVYNQIKKFEIIYDSDDEKYIYKAINKFLKQRYVWRLNRFNSLKIKYNLNFTIEAEEMFYNFLDFV